MAKFVAAGADATITLKSKGETTKVDLYSEEGYELLAGLWTKLTAQFRRQYDISWLGVPIIQFPEDIVVLQELIWRVRPDVIVECGIAHGGALLLDRDGEAAAAAGCRFAAVTEAKGLAAWVDDILADDDVDGSLSKGARVG